MDSTLPADQAQGLRRLFAPQPPAGRSFDDVRLVPVVANPHAAHSPWVLERLCSAFGQQGRRLLVVDLADAAAGAEAGTALAGRIEPLAPQLWYLAAGGLPLRWVDSRGSTRRFLQALLDAAPEVDVMLVHGDAAELCRLFDTGGVRPLLLVDDHPAAVAHAYASLKLLAARAGLMSHDLLLSAAARSPRIERIAERLSSCAYAYLGAALHDWAHLDPAGGSPGPALDRLVRAQLQPVPVASAPSASPLPAAPAPH